MSRERLCHQIATRPPPPRPDILRQRLAKAGQQMALAGKQLRESNGLVSAIDPLAAELRFEGVRRLMRRAQIGVNKDHRMGQHHVAAARRQRFSR